MANTDFGGILPLGKLPAGTGNAGLDAYGQASLGAIQSAPSILEHPAFQEIRRLLGQPEGGGLSPNLEKLYGIGERKIARQTSAGVAGAQTMAQSRGMEGGSVDGYLQGQALDRGQQSLDSLLASLLGQQGQNDQQLAGYEFQGAQMDDNRLKLLLDLLMNLGESSANIDMYRSGQDTQLSAARLQREGQVIGGISSGAGAGLGAYLGAL